MRVFTIIIILFSAVTAGFSYTDESHYSETFERNRTFRVFTPLDYDRANTMKKYRVIYYFHGCGGSYEKSGPYSYADYGLEPVKAIDRPDDEAYEIANNADFENEATAKDIIIIAVDGHIPELPKGCQVYFPTLAETWEDNYYNFSLYIRELIDVVDDRYHTMVGPQYRAVSGLSMGGHMATWVAATNPHLFSSASQFCYGPNYYDVGDPDFQTTVDIRELWRNLRGLPFRHTTADRDYLRYYSEYLYEIFTGAGFENEFYLADNCHHAAARVDLQFDFHLNRFDKQKENPACFSHVNLYPEFEIWGYEIGSDKIGNGWIYLHDVTKNGLGIYTRKRLPWGQGLKEFDIRVTTPEYYTANTNYVLSRYSYKNEAFTTETITSDQQGKLHISSIGGTGEEIGILGDDLAPPIIVLADTVNENIFLEDDRETTLSFEVVNLSLFPQTVDFDISTENSELLTILSPVKKMTIPAQSKIKIDSFVVLKGRYFPSNQNVGYLKISSSIDDIPVDRVQYRQVQVKAPQLKLEVAQIKIIDGHSETLPVFKYGWGSWDPHKSEMITEGEGNGNGIVEAGEVFSIWIQPTQAYDTSDYSTWHPTTPINFGDNSDISVEQIMQHSFSTGKSVVSAQLRLNRTPTAEHPIRIPLQSEFLKITPLVDDCHRNTADNFRYSFVNLILGPDGTIQIDSD